MTIQLTIDQNTHTCTITSNGGMFTMSLSNSSIHIDLNNDTLLTTVNNTTQHQHVKKQMGVTTYIHEVLEYYPNAINNLNYDYISTNRLVSDDYITDELIGFISKLHKSTDPRLNGICMEALLYQAIEPNISSNIQNDIFNFNALAKSTNLLPTLRNDSVFMDIYKSVCDYYSTIDFDFVDPDVISFTHINNTSKEFDITKCDGIHGILYLAAYAYNNIQRNGFQTDNYTVNDVIDYCKILIDNSQTFTTLCTYVQEISKNIKSSFDKIVEIHVDVPINEVTTQSCKLVGNIDLLINTGDQYELYDIKCCRCDDMYVTSKWPQQLNLYKLGLSSDIKINSMNIVNVFTNNMYSYEVNDNLVGNDFP